MIFDIKIFVYIYKYICKLFDVLILTDLIIMKSSIKSDKNGDDIKTSNIIFEEYEQRDPVLKILPTRG